VQNQYNYFWTEDRVRETLEQTMRTAFAGVYAEAVRHGTDMRTGAYILAVGRVAEATRVRGIFP
jgi:glutamate dehydrogenase/leucine dehydrogenase